ncbi:expressed protein [Echinococcus multilocularis]|uniref:Expressed protein n=1 Tax=Echinococcus multilocularis TaxID=6211 RepID=A0A068XZM7_ECHMU|nr:expressed protein [Echinococcus multilocularis]
MTWQKTRASAQFFIASIFIPVAKKAKEGRKKGYRLFGRSLSDRLENWLTVPLLLAKNTHKITHSRITINATRTLQQTFLSSFPSLNTRFVLLWSSELLASRSCVALLCVSVFLAVRHVSSSSPSSHCFIHSLDGQIDM